MTQATSQPRLQPVRCCSDVCLVLRGETLNCNGCGRRGEPGGQEVIIALPEGDGPIESEQYRQGTKHRYQSEEYAGRYLQEYRAPTSASDLYARYIANREREAVRRALFPLAGEVSSVLDLPAGTGKLAKVHAGFPYRVVASDVSVEMLGEGFSRGEWDGCQRVGGFVQSDVMHLRFGDDTFDCAVCLRLLHRLPEDLVLRALTELQRVTRRYLVVSNRVTGRSLVGALRRRRTHRAQFDRSGWNEVLSRFGTVDRHHFVSPFVSTEVVSVVRLA